LRAGGRKGVTLGQRSTALGAGGREPVRASVWGTGGGRVRPKGEGRSGAGRNGRRAKDRGTNEPKRCEAGGPARNGVQGARWEGRSSGTRRACAPVLMKPAGSSDDKFDDRDRLGDE
jgi:hypothetical protein